MTTEHTTNEMVASRIFMLSVSAKVAMENDKLSKIMERSGCKKEELASSGGSYSVFFSVNGIELDFFSFEKEYINQLDRLITEAAAALVKEQIGDKIYQMTEKVNDALQELTEGVRRKAAEALGFDPWADGNRDR